MKTRTNVSVKALAIAIGLALAGNCLIARGTVQVDLRFADGSKTMRAAPGDFAIDVWVAVVGTDPAKRDGLVYIFGSAQTAQLGGGAVLGGPGVGIVANTAAPGGAFTITPLLGLPGTPKDTTHDGIQDWGTPQHYAYDPAEDALRYSSAQNAPGGAPGTAPIYSDSPGVIARSIPDGTEYKVGTLTFHIDQVSYSALSADATTRIDWARPQLNAPPPHLSLADEVSNASLATYLPSVPGVNSVEFTGAQPAAGYSYATAASSPRIAKVQLPDVGGGTFDLYAPADEAITPPAAPGLAGADSDGAVRALAPAGGDWVLIASGVTAGSLYSLPYPVSALQVLGINPAAGIDPNDPSAFPVNFFYEGDATGSVTRVALTPEPASLALLGLGGLALLRRGRR